MRGADADVPLAEQVRSCIAGRARCVHADLLASVACPDAHFSGAVITFTWAASKRSVRAALGRWLPVGHGRLTVLQGCGTCCRACSSEALLKLGLCQRLTRCAARPAAHADLLQGAGDGQGADRALAAEVRAAGERGVARSLSGPKDCLQQGGRTARSGGLGCCQSTPHARVLPSWGVGATEGGPHSLDPLVPV